MHNYKTKKDKIIKLNNRIKWKNKNTNTVEIGNIISILNNKILAIGNHYVSWVLIKDVEILEIID
jgi:hypothetical protein